MYQDSYKIVIIAGATAVGKSAVAMDLCHLIGGEIISCDSAQVYKYMDIGTAKPGQSDREKIAHHLIDIVKPDYDYTAADFKSDCAAAVEDILRRKKTPVICGGTGLYLNSFLFDYKLGGTGADSALRKQLSAVYDVHGADATHKILKVLDSESAAKIHPNDKRRVVRALEVFLIAGKGRDNRQTQKRKISKYNYLYVVVTKNREALYDNINSRVDSMIKQGLVDEVKKLTQQGYGLKNKSMHAIGYKEIIGFLSGQSNFESAIDRLKQNTRNYAKRQLTWFKAQQDAIFLENNDKIVENIVKLLK